MPKSSKAKCAKVHNLLNFRNLQDPIIEDVPDEELPQVSSPLNQSIQVEIQQVSNGEYEEDNGENITEVTALENSLETLHRAQEMAAAVKWPGLAQKPGLGPGPQAPGLSKALNWALSPHQGPAHFKGQPTQAQAWAYNKMGTLLNPE
ncbi:hypothetical protein H2248_005411 [Termitomyces sp. 'cryptogamus']|nr:hypothetical protein H2248_005411 [Termitomyces sp. 'cryptogamus']